MKAEKNLKRLRKNYSWFVCLPGKIINIIQLFSFQLYEIIIICSKSAKVTLKLCLGTILISPFFRIKLFEVINSVGRKISGNFFWTFLFNKWKIWLMWSSFWRKTSRGAQLIILVTQVKITQSKPFLFFRKMSAPEKHG